MRLRSISDALLRDGCRQADQALPPSAADALCDELQRDLHEDVSATPLMPTPSAKHGAIVLLACVVTSGLIYALSGRAGAVWAERQRQANMVSSFSPAEEAQRELATLLTAIRAAPQDSARWARLGEYFLSRNDYAAARRAYRQALTLNNRDAALYTALATVLYYQAGQRMTPQARQLIDNALARDPADVTAQMLLAADAFLQADYAQAIARWQRLLDANSPRINRTQLVEAINMAKLLQRQQR